MLASSDSPRDSGTVETSTLTTDGPLWEHGFFYEKTYPHSHALRRTCDSTPHFGHFFLVQVVGLGTLASSFRSTFSFSARTESA